jgi:hypothetical protein
MHSQAKELRIFAIDGFFHGGYRFQSLRTSLFRHFGILFFHRGFFPGTSFFHHFAFSCGLSFLSANIVRSCRMPAESIESLKNYAEDEVESIMRANTFINTRSQKCTVGWVDIGYLNAKFCAAFHGLPFGVVKLCGTPIVCGENCCDVVTNESPFISSYRTACSSQRIQSAAHDACLSRLHPNQCSLASKQHNFRP